VGVESRNQRAEDPGAPGLHCAQQRTEDRRTKVKDCGALTTSQHSLRSTSQKNFEHRTFNVQPRRPPEVSPIYRDTRDFALLNIECGIPTSRGDVSNPAPEFYRTYRREKLRLTRILHRRERRVPTSRDILKKYCVLRIANDLSRRWLDTADASRTMTSHGQPRPAATGRRHGGRDRVSAGRQHSVTCDKRYILHKSSRLVGTSAVRNVG